MASILPIPSSRVSDSLARQRLLFQLSFDQRELVRLQTQLSTLRRVTTPSDDPQAAVRAIEVQRLLERKEQMLKNLTTNQSFLTATDTAVSSVTDLLRTVRSDALAVIGTTASDEQRTAVVQEINAAIKELIGTGNRQFRGRYLFSGSRTQQSPFELSGTAVRYQGNELKLESFSDIEQLFDTNQDGHEVFGALSDASHGALPAIPSVSAYTRLSELRGGLGIDLGSVQISDGTNTSTVDLSSAQTLGDVAELLAANPPTSRTLTVEVTSSGLSLQLDSSGGGSLTVSEVSGGETASQLGILETAGVGTEVLVGDSLSPRQRTDLNPIVTEDTRLVDLRGGAGISIGSFVISDGTNSSVIDVSGAETVGDVVRLIEANPPPGRVATVRVTSRGLTIELNGGNLSINEVSAGTVAAELGILLPNGSGPGPLVGGDLDPRITATTPLANLAGARAAAIVSPAGVSNDLVFTAVERGNAFNNVTIQFIDDGSVTAGNEVVTYDDSSPLNKTLTIKIESGVTTAQQVIDAVQSQVGAVFQAALDGKETDNLGTGTILATSSDPLATGRTRGGAGVEFDASSGLQIVNGGQTHTISFATLGSDATVNDLLNLLNASGAGVQAEINPDASGIDIRSRLSGADFAVGENGGDSATHLGARSLHLDTRLVELNFGRGVHLVEGAEFLIQKKDGTRLSIDVSAAETIGDVVERINTDPANQDPAHRVVAQLNASGNGITLTTTDSSSTAPFQVIRTNNSEAAIDLGLVAAGQDESAPASVSGGTETIAGSDANPLEVAGVFTALGRLRDALTDNDDRAIERAVALLDHSIDQVNFSRAALGAQQQALDLLNHRLEDEKIELTAVVSQEIDADLPAVITEFSARQAAYEATLRVTAQLFQLSLLNFI